MHFTEAHRLATMEYNECRNNESGRAFIHPGAVFQVVEAPNSSTVRGGAIVIAAEVAPWGIKAVLPGADVTDNPVPLFVRLEWRLIEFIGYAPLPRWEEGAWVREDDGDDDAGG